MPSEVVTGKSTSEIENVEWTAGTTAGSTQYQARFGSSSSQASQSSGDICRICHCESDTYNPLLTPCYCSGSLKYVHQSCLQQWLTASETNYCELCKFPFIMHTKIKPFNEWRSLEMSGVERRRLCCAVLFHCAAALCVIWSLCVLIERAAEEVKRGLIGWPFWTKLAVVTVGLTGGLVFMYIQCRQYLHLCHRWRARNRILLIQNAPEKIHPPSPPMTTRNIPRNNSATAASATVSNSYNNSACGYTSASSNRPNYKHNQNCLPQGQIVANIENNSQNYERDWTLDDVSQISSFRPCAQGSGSMTPFHDSFHNVPNSQSSDVSLNGSQHDLNKGTESNPCGSSERVTSEYQTRPSTVALKPTSINTEMTSNTKYPNSSVFLENRDILDDCGYPKIAYRHSSILTSPDISDNLDKILGKDLRRYSDTKLLNCENNVLSPIFNVALNAEPNTFHQQSPKYLHRGREQPTPKAKSSRKAGDNVLNEGQEITDIIFEDTHKLDPLEFNIQEMLEMDTRHASSSNCQFDGHPNSSSNNCNSHSDKKSRHSLDTAVERTDAEADDGFDRSRLFFKSLPNLSSSCESLIKK